MPWRSCCEDREANPSNRDVAGQRLDDGLLFETDSIAGRIIRDGDVYSGVRVKLAGSLARARFSFHVDVNVGDPIWPGPEPVSLPRLLGGELELLGYPLAMVFAEKLVTAVQRGVANTRWRDLADVYTLSGDHVVNGDELATAVERVARYRQAGLVSLSTRLDGYAEASQSRWSLWRRDQLLEDRLPESFALVVSAVASFADPVFGGAVRGQRWDPATRSWQ